MEITGSDYTTENRVESGPQLRLYVSIQFTPRQTITDTGGYSSWAIAVARWGIATFNSTSLQPVQLLRTKITNSALTVVGTTDRPWWAGISFTLSIFEVQTGLICACVATLAPLWKLACSHVRDWTGWSSHQSTKVMTWPSFVRKPDDTQSSGDTKKSAGYWARAANNTIGGHDNPAGRGKPASSYADTTLNGTQDDEYGLLDVSDWRYAAMREDRSQRSVDV